VFKLPLQQQQQQRQKQQQTAARVCVCVVILWVFSRWAFASHIYFSRKYRSKIVFSNRKSCSLKIWTFFRSPKKEKLTLKTWHKFCYYSNTIYKQLSSFHHISLKSISTQFKDPQYFFVYVDLLRKISSFQLV
jgi:hypothetical protein